MQKISELQYMKQQLESVLAEARMLNKNVRIKSSFQIELAD